MLKYLLQSRNWPRRSPAWVARQAALLFKGMPPHLRGPTAENVATKTKRHDLRRVALLAAGLEPATEIETHWFEEVLGELLLNLIRAATSSILVIAEPAFGTRRCAMSAPPGIEDLSAYSAAASW
jgi:hypothetical protein